jgi:hypothetical protein
MFIFLAVIWNTTNTLNVIIKILLIVLAIFGTVLSLEKFGYIIKVIGV